MSATEGTTAGFGVAVLLRAINVGGRKLKMADLRDAVAGLDLDNVGTYLQSGNLVCRIPPDRLDGLGTSITDTIASATGLDTSAVVRTHAELAAVADSSPYPIEDPKLVHVIFLETRPEAEAVAGLDPDRSPPDHFTCIDRELYLDFPNGSARSKLTLDWFERQLGVRGTGRNFNTVRALRDLTGEPT